MSIKRLIVFVLIAPLALPVSTQGKPAGRSLTFQVEATKTGGKTAPSVECVVDAGPQMPICALAFGSDGKTLAVGGYKEVLIWDLAGAALARRIGADQITGGVHALAFLKDPKQIAVGEGTPYGPGAVRIFDITTGQQTGVFTEPKDIVYALAVSADGKRIAAGGADNRCRVWDIETKKIARVIDLHTDWVLAAAFSPDGKSLATAGADSMVYVWNTETWESTAKTQQVAAVRSLRISADNQLTASAVGGPKINGVRIQRIRDRRQTIMMYTLAAAPLDIAWTARPNRMYVACSDGAIKVFDGANARLLATLTGHKDWVYALAVSGDGKTLASADGDGIVKIWNTADNRLLATLVQLSCGKDDALIVTPQGYAAGAPADAVKWKTADAKRTPEALAKLFWNADSVKKVLAGEKVTPPTFDDKQEPK